MQKNIYTLSVIAIVFLFFSCNKPSCVAPVIKYVDFYSAGGPITDITDTSATIYKYNAGSTFSQLAESFPTAYFNKNKQIALPYNGAETYGYDWLIILAPSGKTYAISNITHDDKNSSGDNCTSTVTYRLNDSLVTVPGNPYSTTPNYTSDIQVKW